MKILHLTLKKKWFDMIASGEKKEEYREIKPYWIKRLMLDVEVTDPTKITDYEWLIKELKSGSKNVSFCFPTHTHVKFRNGYAENAPDAVADCLGFRIGEGKEEWGAVKGEKYFIVELGDLLTIH